MIPVERKSEPPGFDTEVRQPGKNWIIQKGLPTTGPVPPKTKFEPFWEKCAIDLRKFYSRYCAFVAVYIPPVVGNPTCEHFLPKSKYAEHVYEWDNYRLVCGTMNGRKGMHMDVLDPFQISNGTFQLTRSLIVEPGDLLANPSAIRTEAINTISRLKLNDCECMALRERDWTLFVNRQISATALKENSPFVYSEMVRLGVVDPNLIGLLP